MLLLFIGCCLLIQANCKPVIDKGQDSAVTIKATHDIGNFHESGDSKRVVLVKRNADKPGARRCGGECCECGCSHDHCLTCGGHIGGTGGGFGTEQGGVMNWDHGCNCGPGHADCGCGCGGHGGGYGGGGYGGAGYGGAGYGGAGYGGAGYGGGHGGGCGCCHEGLQGYDGHHDQCCCGGCGHGHGCGCGCGDGCGCGHGVATADCGCATGNGYSTVGYGH